MVQKVTVGQVPVGYVSVCMLQHSPLKHGKHGKARDCSIAELAKDCGNIEGTGTANR